MAMARNFSKHLLSHDVFNTSVEDGEAVKTFGNPHIVGVPRNQMATRGNDLFVAVGNTVRCIDASNETTEPKRYKRLDVASVDFLIHSLCINNAGTLLAIVGETKVVACLLPPSGALSDKETCIKVRNRKVGRIEKEKVLKVMWNPIARYDSNLVVLTSDDYLRAYNLSWSYEDPEYSYCLTGKNSTSEEEFGVDYDELEDPISFTLGSAAEPHGRFTLYVLTKSGDIFGLCPWVPSQFTLSKEEVEDMFDASVSLEYEYRQSPDSKLSIRRHYKQQLAWASQIWKQLSTSMVESRLSRDGSLYDYHILKRPERPPQDRQGPFSYQPFPETLYEGEALDITVVDAGAMTALAVSYSTGRITFFLQDISLDMKWEGSGISPEICLATVESIQLPNSNNGNRKVGLHVEPNEDLCIFAIESEQIYRIDLSSWAIPLTYAMECGDLKQVEHAIENSGHADINELIDTKDKSGVKGFALLDDLIGTHYSVAKTNFGLWVDQWNEDHNELDPSDKKTAVPLTLRDTTNADDSGKEELTYEPMFSKQSVEAELKSLLDSVEFIAPKPTAPGLSTAEKIPTTMEGLEYFGNLSNFYYHELSKVEKAGTIMHKRLQGQRSELHRQLDELGKLSKQLTNVNENHVPDRLQSVLTRQADLQKRSSEVLQKLAKSRALLLSEQEKKWFTELKRLQQRIYAGGGFEKRTRNAITQADVILKEFQLLNNDKAQETPRSGIDAENVAKLQALLARESEVIDNTKKTLQKLLHDNITEQLGSLTI